VKPTRLLRHLITIGTSQQGGDLIVDFFAGSGPTGHATMLKNAEDGGDRRFVLVQLPEPLPVPEVKVKTIADLTKSRLRKAGEKIREEKPLFAGDLGFRVLKLDSSNINAWDPDRENLDQALLDSMEHVKPDRSDDDVLYELLLKLGLDLCVPIEQKTIAKKVVHSIGAGALIVCLATKISRDDAEPLSLGIVEWHKQQNPAGESTVVFRDRAFSDDVAKTNLAAILQQHGLENVRSL
jgi:adenine-specific DNA-methyltransferase